MKLILISIILSIFHSSKSLKLDKSLIQISNFVCEVVQDEINLNSNIKIITIVEINEIPSKIYKNIFNCLPNEISKIILTPNTESESFRFPSTFLTIFIGDKVTNIRDYIQTSFDHLSKFIFILNNEENPQKVIKTCEQNGILNFFVISTKDEGVELMIPNKFAKTLKINLREIQMMKKNISKSLILFPNNKLNNIHRYPINVTFYPIGADFSMTSKTGRILNQYQYFVDIIEEKLNATIKYPKLGKNSSTLDEYVEESKNDFYEIYFSLWLGLNLAKEFPSGYGEILTFEQQEQCFEVPLPKIIPIYEQILIRPFDSRCWIFLSVTIIISAFIWRLFKKFDAVDSHWDFIFATFAFFLGQSKKIKTKKIILIILMQILIFALFIFGNGYQSLVTSFMLNPLQQKKLKSVRELLESDQKIFYDEDFHATMEDNPKYQTLINDKRVNLGSLEAKDDEAQIWPCYFIDFRMRNSPNKDVTWDKQYKISDIVYSYQLVLRIGLFNPFQEKFQQLMQLSFEAGLMSAWKVMNHEYFLDPPEQSYVHERFKFLLASKEILDFSSMIPIFAILLIGSLISLIALLIEIFYHDFLVPYFKYKKAKRNIRKFIKFN